MDTNERDPLFTEPAGLRWDRRAITVGHYDDDGEWVYENLELAEVLMDIRTGINPEIVELHRSGQSADEVSDYYCEREYLFSGIYELIDDELHERSLSGIVDLRFFAEDAVLIEAQKNPYVAFAFTDVSGYMLSIGVLLSPILSTPDLIEVAIREIADFFYEKTGEWCIYEDERAYALGTGGSYDPNIYINLDAQEFTLGSLPNPGTRKPEVVITCGDQKTRMDPEEFKRQQGDRLPPHLRS